MSPWSPEEVPGPTSAAHRSAMDRMSRKRAFLPRRLDSRSKRSRSASVIAPVLVVPVSRASSLARRHVSSFLMLRPIGPRHEVDGKPAPYHAFTRRHVMGPAARGSGCCLGDGRLDGFATARAELAPRMGSQRRQLNDMPRVDATLEGQRCRHLVGRSLATAPLAVEPTMPRAAQSANVANAARLETIHRIEDSFSILRRQILHVLPGSIGIADGQRPNRSRSSAAETTRPSSTSRSPSAIASASLGVTASSSSGALASADATGSESDGADNPASIRPAASKASSGKASTKRCI